MRNSETLPVHGLLARQCSSIDSLNEKYTVVIGNKAKLICGGLGLLACKLKTRKLRFELIFDWLFGANQGYPGK